MRRPITSRATVLSVFGFRAGRKPSGASKAYDGPRQPRYRPLVTGLLLARWREWQAERAEAARLAGIEAALATERRVAVRTRLARAMGRD